MSARMMPALLAALLVPEILGAARVDKTTDGVFEQQLRAQYVLAQASHFNRVSSAGTVVVIQQDGLSSAPPASLTGATGWYRNTFKDGKRQNHGLREMAWQNTGTLRAIQTGDRFYVSKIDIKDNAITFYLVSCDQIDGQYYYAGVSFQFPKGYQSSLTFQDIQQTISQVITIEEQNQTQGGQRAAQVQSGSTAPAAPSATPAPIEPPPPPADAPPTTINIGIGQKPEEVKSTLGQPERIFKVGSKEIYSYKNLKITFVDGKVSDIE